ncbi:MAG TPA: NAD-dependent epimerase/dehydratase family protein [Candidatus Deferrimicrobium sp.]|nr:NAD-dependent epimerase/dehydratase family protein [Candidatus Deferrimicrobium sp.]
MSGKILITGANGSYGSALWKIAKEWGYEVYGTDVMDSKEKNYIKADITDPNSIKPLAKLGVDAVIHTAGVIDMMKTELHQKVHIEGTSNLIDLFKNTELKAFVSVSSAAIHGGTLEDVFITEKMPRVLKDSYTISKAQQYDLTLQKFGEKSMIIEPSLVYDEKNRYLFKQIAELIALNILPALPDNGNLWVGMVHPIDLATGTLMAIERGDFGQSYIICDEKPLRMIEMATLVAQATNARIPTRSIRLEVLDRLLKMLGMVDTLLPALEGMEPMASMMGDMGIDLAKFKMPMDPEYMRTHHKYTSAKLMEVTKKNAKKYRVNEATLKKYPDGWKPEVDPKVEMPKVLKYWTEQDPPIIKKDAQYPDVIEFLFDQVAGML